jgi:hypothetical protein
MAAMTWCDSATSAAASSPRRTRRRCSSISAAGSTAASSVPNDPDTLLTRLACAKALTAYGLPTSAATLATMATRGGGPPFQKYGQRAIYHWGISLRWALDRLSPLVNSTSEAELVVKAETGDERA